MADIRLPVNDTDTVTWVFNPPTDAQAAVRKQMSLTSDASGLKLSGDANTPGNSKYYGTNSGGTKGFFDLPTLTGPLTTKGDLFTFSTLAARLPVGTTGQVLTVDPAEATGIKWATPSGGGGGMSIGGSVTSGTANRALFVATGPVLADSKDLGASPAASDITAGFTSPTDDAHVIRLGFLSGTSLKGYIESARQSSTNDGYLAFVTRAGASTWTEALRIDATQNVGIGIGTMGSRLHVASNDDATSFVRVDRLTANIQTSLGSANTSSVGYVGTMSGHNFQLRRGGTAIAVVDSTGIAIGTTTANTYRLNTVGAPVFFGHDIGSSPGTFDVQMAVYSTTSARKTRLAFSDGSDVKAIIQTERETSANDGYIAFQTRAGAATMTEIMRCTSSAVQIAGLTASRPVLTDASKNLVSGSAGANFGPAHPASITVVNGIVTAVS